MCKPLYIVEGLPCSGKSTTAKYIADLLQGACIDEGSGNHPADYEFHAYVTQAEMAQLPKAWQDLLPEYEIIQGGYLIPLASLTETGPLFEALLQHKIYDFLPWEVEKPIMLEKWHQFGKAYTKGMHEQTYVFNCVFLQNPMCETMMRFGFEEEVSKAYIEDIIKQMPEVEVKVIYLKNEQIRASIAAAIPERGEEWLNGVIDYHVNGAYGKDKQLEGFEGYIAALEERQRRELKILKSLPVASLVIENAQENWERAYQQIAQWLQGC